MAINERTILAVARWFTRIVGTAIIALIVALAVGEGVSNPLATPIREQLLSIALVTMIVGLVAAWKWEGIGGLLILGGWVLFAVVNHGIRLNLVFGPMFLVGLLYLGCWWMKRNVASSPP